MVFSKKQQAEKQSQPLPGTFDTGSFADYIRRVAKQHRLHCKSIGSD
jgi:hypothetical protein